MAVEKQQRCQRLVLRCRRYLALVAQKGQKGLHLRCAHLPGMTFVVEDNEALDPAGIGLFGTQAVMAQPALLAHLVKQTWRLGRACYTGRLRGVIHRTFLEGCNHLKGGWDGTATKPVSG